MSTPTLDLTQSILDQSSPVARRSAMLAQAHPWMDPQVNATLASSQHDDPTMLGVAQRLKDAVAATWDGFSHWDDDPVLHKTDTAGLALHRYLSAAIGPVPVKDADLAHIQTRLQDLGYGKGLAADGVWNPDWNGEYGRWSSDVTARDYAGDKPGSVSVAKAAHHWYDAIMPTHIANAIVGFAESIPGDLRSLVADVGGNFVGLGQAAKHPVTLQGVKQSSSAGTASIETALGNPMTGEEVQRQGVSRAVGDVGTVLLLAPVAGGTGSIARAAARDMAAGYSRDYAARGPGVVAKSLFGGRSAQDLARLGVTETARGGLVNTRFVANMPLMRQISPVLGRLADESGYYYRARTFVARPYARPTVRIAGRVGQQASLYGVGVQGVAALAPADSALASDVGHTHVFDEVDANLRRATSPVFGGHFALSLNDLAYVMHGDLAGPNRLSQKIGDRTHAFVGATSDALGPLGVHGAAEMAYDTTIEDLARTYGSDEHLDRALRDKLANLAAAHSVQVALNGEEGLSTAERIRRSGELHNQVWADPAAHSDAVAKLVSSPYVLRNRLLADATKGGQDAKAALRHDADQFSRAGDILTNEVIRTGKARYLHGSRGEALIKDASDDFDFGGDTLTPTRTTTLTRRGWNANVGMLRDRVAGTVGRAQDVITAQAQRARQALDDAHAQLAQAVTPEERKAAQALVFNASGRVANAERSANVLATALDSGRFDPVVKLLDETRDTAAYLKPQLAQLRKDWTRLRGLLIQAEPVGTELSVHEALAKAADPDLLYTRVNGPPRAVPREIGTGDWMQSVMAHENGSVGIARLDSLTQQSAAPIIAGFRARAAALDPADVAGEDALRTAIKEHLFVNHNSDDRSLDVFSTADLLDVAQAHADRLASDVFYTHDADQAVRDAHARIRKLGYKIVVGSHIGHAYDGTLPPMADLDGALTRRRRVNNRMGLNVDPIATRTVSDAARIAIQNELMKSVAAGDIVLPPLHNAASLMGFLRDVKDPALSHLQNLVFAVSRAATFGHAHAGAIAKIAAKYSLGTEEAVARYKKEIANVMQPRDFPRKKLMALLTTPREVDGPWGTYTWPGMDKESAARAVLAMRKGYARRPKAMMGWSAIEDWGRTGFGFGDRLAYRHPSQDWLQAAANLPNKAVQLRNRLRFDMSLLFDLRRIVKQNYKMGLKGVPWTADPLGALDREGAFDDAHHLLRRLVGGEETAGYDEADRYLHQQSMWGFYNGRNYEAYFAHHLAKEGLSDEEIRAAIHEVFDYGSIRGGGRSALERSTNTVFFPFSFEKTLLRNTGTFLLDHPGQAMLLTTAIEEYSKANDHEQVHRWIQDHLPLVADMQKLNAFSHGISPGELGGINAPSIALVHSAIKTATGKDATDAQVFHHRLALLNLFLPQTWGAQLSTDNLRRYLPVFHDFGQLWADTREQGQIGYNFAANTADWAVALGKPRGTFDPYRPTITSQAQQFAGGRKKIAFVTALAGVIDYNDSAADPSQKIAWPDGKGLPATLVGKPIDKTTIGDLIRVWYPDYDPSAARKYVIEQEKKSAASIAAIKDPARRADYTTFASYANRYASYIIGDKFTTDQARQVDKVFRSTAIALSQSDPGFLSWYDAHYRRSFGPLTAITDPGKS